MPTEVEAPVRRDRKVAPEIVPPVVATTAVEQSHGIIHVGDAASRATIGKSNAVVGGKLNEAFKAMGRLSKTVFGGVAQVFTAFGALRNMLKEI